MTDEERAALRELFRQSTIRDTASPAIARQSLIDQGFLTKKGKLRKIFIDPKK